MIKLRIDPWELPNDQLPIWDLIKDAAGELAVPMTAQDILGWFTDHHPDVQPNTLRSQIAVAVGNSKSYLNHRVYSRRPPLLWSVGWGRYEPYDLERHGEPRADAEADEAGDYILGGFDRKSEVSTLWETDETTAGDVWRRLNRGETPQQIAEQDGITVGPVYSFINLHNALLDGTVSSSPSVARGVAGRVRKWLRTKPLSDELRRALEQQERSLNAVVNDSRASEAESEEALEKSKAAEAENIAGIYVYTLPHYVRYPFDRKTGRTLLKVGHSSVDALYRATSQGRVTSLPEDPWLLRIYPAEASSHVERQFHGFLRDADHEGVRGTRIGAEWFLTSLKFLDRIATTTGLEIRIVNDFAIDDE